MSNIERYYKYLRKCEMMIDSTSFKGCDKLDTSGFCV